MDVRDHVLHRQQKYRDEANAGIAAAIAMEAAPYLPDHITYAIGSGYYGNQGAIGVTLRATAENGRWSVTTGASTSEPGTALRTGVSGALWAVTDRASRNSTNTRSGTAPQMPPIHSWVL